MSLSKMLQEYREGLRGLPTYDELAAIASPDQCADPIVERNVSLLRQRSTVGVQKYGTTLADNKLPLRAWLNHALEEALDQANYLQAAMAEIDSAERALPPLPQYFPDVTDIRADEELRAQKYAKDYARSALAACKVRTQEPAIGEVWSREKQDEFAEALQQYEGDTPAQPVAVPDGVIAWHCVNEVTGKMLYTDSESEMINMRDANAKHWKITALKAAAPAAQPEVRKPIMWAALNMNGKAVFVNQDKSACDIERLCIKTPTTIVPLCAGAPEPK